MNAPKGFTRRTAPEFLTREGFPTTYRQFVKACLPSAPGGAIPIDYWWADRAIYTPETLLRWARARVKTGRTPRGPKTVINGAAPPDAAA